MAIKKSQIPMTIKKLVEGLKDGSIRTDLNVQRNLVWDEERQSLLIHSVLFGYPVPPIYGRLIKSDENNTLWLLDGKQRITTFAKFMDDQLILTDDTPDVDGIEIKGLRYSQLPENMKDDFRSENLSVYRFENMTDPQQDEAFFRLNNGKPLNMIELTRAQASGQVMGFVKEIAHSPFFASSITINDTQKNRMVDEELVLQIVYLLYSEGQVGLSGKEVQRFAKQMKRNGGVPDHQQAMMRKTTVYLGEAFPVREKFLKKVNIPMLFLTAIKAQERNISPVKFGGWAQAFFKRYSSTQHNEYSSATGAGSAKKENVVRRIRIMTDDFDGHIDTAPDYVVPEAKTFGRGRKKSDNSHESGDQDEEQTAL
jgi:hypothetical protein